MKLACDLCEVTFEAKDEDVQLVMERPLYIKCPNGHVLDGEMVLKAARRTETCIHGVDLDVVCCVCSPPFILNVNVKETLEISNPDAIRRLDLNDIPRRDLIPSGGGESLEDIKEIKDERFLTIVEEAVKRPTVLRHEFTGDQGECGHCGEAQSRRSFGKRCEKREE